MLKPDYEGGSLLNLMASLNGPLGLPDSGYPPLASRYRLDTARLSGSRHIVLLVVDGMGDDIINRHAPDGVLARHRIGTLTSVFPSTTASAIPTFLTGLPPQAHGLTGWHMWFQEVSQILAVLPLTPRGTPSGAWVPACATLPGKLFSHQPFSRQLAGRTWTVVPQDIIESSFNQFHTDGARRIGYRGTSGLFAAVEQAVNEAEEIDAGPNPTYIHAYYPALDSLMHEVGTRDERVSQRLAKVDTELAACCERLADRGVSFLVTADHGFIDAPPDHLIDLDHHPELTAILSRPLCGERRVAYAYVEHNRQLDFAAYVNERFSHACRLYRTPDFIAEGWFGPGEPHPHLSSRAGDFVLVMQDDWTIKDWLPQEKHYEQLGVHGGTSAVEMQIPLVMLTP